MTDATLPLADLGTWGAAPDRDDPIDLLRTQEHTRIAWLIPERHRRMAASAFAFFRGSPVVMAADLGRAAHSGLEVQLCGDAHLLNFGFYASPERALLFDINDFDETVRGPFEWDLKRLAASLVIAAQVLQLSAAWQEKVARHGARAYRKELQRLADRPRIDVWYRRIDVDALIAELPAHPFRNHLQQVAAQARHRDSRQAVQKLCTTDSDGQLRIRHAPPLIWRHAEMDVELGIDEPLQLRVEHTYKGYLESVRPELRRFLSGYRLVDTASKAVGVGSVGTRCSIGLLVGSRDDDVLVLQSKQAEASVLAPYATSPSADHQGQRVVEGQRLMQTVSDPLLGWTTNAHHEHLYWRHFRDWKGAVQIEQLNAEGLDRYGELCASTLAKAHARSGDRDALASFMADGKRFDQAIATYGIAYAAQSQADYQRFLAALASGAWEVEPTIPPRGREVLAGSGDGSAPA
jgi:uncharacterized protein (DUF2252 family)